jgi:hypothetical protein
MSLTWGGGGQWLVMLGFANVLQKKTKKTKKFIVVVVVIIVPTI